MLALLLALLRIDRKSLLGRSGGEGGEVRRRSAPEESKDKKCACRGVSLENAKVKSYSPTVLQKGLFAYIILHSSYNR